MEKKGMECVFSCDIDRHAKLAYKKNFGEEPGDDIAAIKNEDVPAHEILCAGFPCQSFSLSGKRNGFDDSRGRLFFDIIRLAKHHKPKILLLENVKNILTIDNGEVIRNVEKSLDKIGYTMHHSMLNAGDYGIPQKRERVYFACLKKDTILGYAEPKKTLKKKYLEEILMPNDECEDLIIKRDYTVTTKTVPEKKLKPIRVGHLNKGGQGERIYSPMGHAVTVSANGGGVGARTGLYLVDGKVRKLHPDEVKRVMGFSTRHKVSDGNQGIKQLGNAVIPSMVARVYEGITGIR